MLCHCVQSSKKKLWTCCEGSGKSGNIDFLFSLYLASYLTTARQRDVSPQERSTGAAAAMHTCRGSKQSTPTVAWLHLETRHKVQRDKNEHAGKVPHLHRLFLFFPDREWRDYMDRWEAARSEKAFPRSDALRTCGQQLMETQRRAAAAGNVESELRPAGAPSLSLSLSL